MHFTRIRISFFTLLIMVAACRTGLTPAPAPTETAMPATVAATPTIVPTTTSEPAPAARFETLKALLPGGWEDRSVFLPTLTEAGQASLADLPGASVYLIELEITAPDGPVNGQMQVRYTNREADSLDAIVFRLFANYNGGAIQVSDVLVEDQPVEHRLEMDDTVLRVLLDQPLEPGNSLVLDLTFSLNIPTDYGGNYGLFGYLDGVLVLDTFYPMIPAYDQEGWYTRLPAPTGDHTYNDASFYLVQVTAPLDLTLVASGSPVSAQTQDGQQVVILAAGPARDFYLAASADLVPGQQQAGQVTISSYSRPGWEENRLVALRTAVQAVQTFSDLIGPYPYTEFDIFSMPMLALGIEYPGMTGILSRLYEPNQSAFGVDNSLVLENVVAHEVAHQWFYNAVGNNQQDHPWLDEALAQYLTYLYFQETYGPEVARNYAQDWQRRWDMVAAQPIPVGLPVEEYSGVEYSAIVYGRGPLFYLELEQELGQEVLLAGLREFYAAQLWETGETVEMRASLEAACACDLSDYFEEWIYSSAETDD